MPTTRNQRASKPSDNRACLPLFLVVCVVIGAFQISITAGIILLALIASGLVFLFLKWQLSKPRRIPGVTVGLTGWDLLRWPDCAVYPEPVPSRLPPAGAHGNIGNTKEYRQWLREERYRYLLQLGMYELFLLATKLLRYAPAGIPLKEDEIQALTLDYESNHLDKEYLVQKIFEDYGNYVTPTTASPIADPSKQASAFRAMFVMLALFAGILVSLPFLGAPIVYPAAWAVCIVLSVIFAGLFCWLWLTRRHKKNG